MAVTEGEDLENGCGVRRTWNLYLEGRQAGGRGRQAGSVGLLYHVAENMAALNEKLRHVQPSMYCGWEGVWRNCTISLYASPSTKLILINIYQLVNFHITFLGI